MLASKKSSRVTAQEENSNKKMRKRGAPARPPGTKTVDRVTMAADKADKSGIGDGESFDEDR